MLLSDKCQLEAYLFHSWAVVFDQIFDKIISTRIKTLPIQIWYHQGVLTL